MVDTVKKRRITKNDWDTVEAYIRSELELRVKNKFRKAHELIWAEVDRQTRMEPGARQVREERSRDDDWHNVIEMGELAKISEVLSADIRRIVFPNNRSWFEAHIADIEDEQEQKNSDAALRALMVQQQQDFGFKARVDLSIKEALHHGSFVAEAVFERDAKIHKGVGIENLGSPVWVPHSMWNCYPDSTSAIIGSNMFYNGSMIIRSYQPRHKFKDMAKGKGWMAAQIRVVMNKGKGTDRNKDIELLTYHGDLSIPRKDGDILLLNSKVILADGKIVFYATNDLPYPAVIFSGYERIDVRDPYYISPIIKLSPMQKLASHTANKLMDSLDLKVEPPLIYDASDPDFVSNGGPAIFPGAKSGTRGSTAYEVIEAGDPAAALSGLDMILFQMQSGSGVDTPRTGASNAGDKTATEVRRAAQSGEIRTIDFVDKLENQGLKPFLYFQHELNKEHMQSYSFYNPEIGAPDFMRGTKRDLPKSVHFEIVGSKGVLGEEERTEKTAMVTSFLMGNEMTAGLVNTTEIAKQMLQDAGNKNPERFLNLDEGQGPQAQQLEQVQREAQQVIQQLQGELEKAQSGEEVKLAKIQSDQEIAAAKLEHQRFIDIQRLEHDINMARVDAGLEERKLETQTELKAREIENDEQMMIIKEQENEQGQELKADVKEVAEKVDDFMDRANEPITVIRDQSGRIVSIKTETAGEKKIKRDKEGRIAAIG